MNLIRTGAKIVTRGVAVFFIGKGLINTLGDESEDQSKNFILGIFLYLISNVFSTRTKNKHNSIEIFDTVNGVSEGNFQFYNIKQTRKELLGNAPKDNSEKEKKVFSSKRPSWFKKDKVVKSDESDLEKAEVKPENKRVFVLQFKGDDEAVDCQDENKFCLPVWDELVFRLNSITKAGDEILLILNSPGGLTYEYGLAASCLDLLKKNGTVRLIVCVDRVAASGGYLMASVADEIVAAPWALIGSIGVVTFTPNVRRAADKLGIDLLQVTSGTYKRTIDPYGEVTPEKMNHVQAELDTVMRQFRNHICKYRPQLLEKIEKIATGETWSGQDAIKYEMIDRLGTSSELIENYLEDSLTAENLYRVVYEKEEKLPLSRFPRSFSALFKMCKTIMTHLNV